jgi:hypothetical protein
VERSKISQSSATRKNNIRSIMTEDRTLLFWETATPGDMLEKYYTM